MRLFENKPHEGAKNIYIDAYCASIDQHHVMPCGSKGRQKTHYESGII